jgi:hypothetical protein
MQYIVDDILNGLDAAKAGVIPFLKGYGFYIDNPTQEQQEYNRKLYISLKKSYFRSVRMNFLFQFQFTNFFRCRLLVTNGTRSYWIRS